MSDRSEPNVCENFANSRDAVRASSRRPVADGQKVLEVAAQVFEGALDPRQIDAVGGGVALILDRPREQAARRGNI